MQCGLPCMEIYEDESIADIISKVHQDRLALRRIESRMNNVEDEVVDVKFSMEIVSPCYEIHEDDAMLQFSVQVPGVKAQDMTVEVIEHEECELRVAGGRKTKKGGGSMEEHFEKTFKLDLNVDTTKITANLADGIIVITAPKVVATDNDVKQIPITQSGVAYTASASTLLGKSTSRCERISPSCEIHEDETMFQYSVEVPGVKPENMIVQVEQHRRQLSLAGAFRRFTLGRKLAKGDEGKEIYFEKTFRLSRSVDTSIISANLSDGIIVITAPKDPTKNCNGIKIPITQPNSLLLSADVPNSHNIPDVAPSKSELAKLPQPPVPPTTTSNLQSSQPTTTSQNKEAAPSAPIRAADTAASNLNGQYAQNLAEIMSDLAAVRKELFKLSLPPSPQTTASALPALGSTLTPPLYAPREEAILSAPTQAQWESKDDAVKKSPNPPTPQTTACHSPAATTLTSLKPFAPPQKTTAQTPNEKKAKSSTTQTVKLSDSARSKGPMTVNHNPHTNLDSNRSSNKNEPKSDLRGLEQMNSNAERLKNVGNNLMAGGHYEDALKAYSQAIRFSPTGPQSHVFYSNRAAASMFLKQYKEAADDARRSIALQPTFARAYARLGQALHFSKDYEGAIAIYEEALRNVEASECEIFHTYIAEATKELEKQQLSTPSNLVKALSFRNFLKTSKKVK